MKIEVPSEHANGTIATTINVLPDTESELLLDFVVASPDGESAITSRIRVRDDLLTAIRDRLDVELSGAVL